MNAITVRLDSLMERLHRIFKPLFEAKWFQMLMSIIIFGNPLAITPQTYFVLTAPSVDGVAAPMWMIFAAIQSAFALHGIQIKKASFFFSMLASLAQSITIIVVVYVRSA